MVSCCLNVRTTRAGGVNVGERAPLGRTARVYKVNARCSPPLDGGGV